MSSAQQYRHFKPSSQELNHILQQKSVYNLQLVLCIFILDTTDNITTNKLGLHKSTSIWHMQQASQVFGTLSKARWTSECVNNTIINQPINQSINQSISQREFVVPSLRKRSRVHYKMSKITIKLRNESSSKTERLQKPSDNSHININTK